MTDYVINTEQLKQIKDMVFREDEPAFEKLSWKIVSNPLSEHDAEIAKKERGRVLDELVTYCKDEENLIYKDRPYGGWDDATLDQKWLLEKIESLRGEP
jgi:hypothetical protein